MTNEEVEKILKWKEYNPEEMKKWIETSNWQWENKRPGTDLRFKEYINKYFKGEKK